MFHCRYNFINVAWPITDGCCIQTIVVSELKNETQTVSRVKTKTKTLTIHILSWDLCPDQDIDSHHFRGGDPLWRYAILELHARNDDDPLPQPSKKIFGRTLWLHPRCLHSGLPSDNVASGLRERQSRFLTAHQHKTGHSVPRRPEVCPLPSLHRVEWIAFEILLCVPVPCIDIVHFVCE